MTTNQLRTITASNDTEALATLFVGLLLGWTNQVKIKEIGPSYEGEGDSLPFGVDQEEIPGICEIEREDWEYEWADSSDVSSPYFTTSGDNPIITDTSFQADQTCRLINENQAPDKRHYSDARPANMRTWRRKHSMMLQWVTAIEKNYHRPERLQTLWKQFWKAFFSKSDDQRADWLFKKDIALIRATFAKHGVVSKKKKVA